MLSLHTQTPVVSQTSVISAQRSKLASDYISMCLASVSDICGVWLLLVNHPQPKPKTQHQDQAACIKRIIQMIQAEHLACLHVLHTSFKLDCWFQRWSTARACGLTCVLESRAVALGRQQQYYSNFHGWTRAATTLAWYCLQPTMIMLFATPVQCRLLLKRRLCKTYLIFFSLSRSSRSLVSKAEDVSWLNLPSL